MFVPSDVCPIHCHVTVLMTSMVASGTKRCPAAPNFVYGNYMWHSQSESGIKGRENIILFLNMSRTNIQAKTVNHAKLL